MRLEISRTDGRLGLIGLAVFGLAHILAPRLLLRVARRAYGLALDVEFVPREGAPWRVRLVGFCSLVACAVGRAELDRTVGSITFSTSPPNPPSAEHSADDH